MLLCYAHYCSVELLFFLLCWSLFFCVGHLFPMPSVFLLCQAFFFSLEHISSLPSVFLLCRSFSSMPSREGKGTRQRRKCSAKTKKQQKKTWTTITLRLEQTTDTIQTTDGQLGNTNFTLPKPLWLGTTNFILPNHRSREIIPLPYLSPVDKTRQDKII